VVNPIEGKPQKKKIKLKKNNQASIGEPTKLGLISKTCNS
jgi:hypothetical protein